MVGVIRAEMKPLHQDKTVYIKVPSCMSGISHNTAYNRLTITD